MDLLAKLIGGVVAVLILAVLLHLYRSWKRKVLSKERTRYTYAEIATNYEYWDGYANTFLEGGENLSKTRFMALSTEEKINILTKNFGAQRKSLIEKMNKNS